MPLYHCVDFHWAPEIVYLYPTDLVYSLGVKGASPFSKLLGNIFNEVTGINPRKGQKHTILNYTPDFEERSFVKVTREAQRLLLVSRQYKPEKRLELKKKYTINYELEDAWVAGLLGVIEISSKIKTYNTLKPSNLEEIISIKRPSRGMKDPFLTEKQEETSKIMTNGILRNGRLLNKSTAPISSLESAKLLLENNKYYIVKNKEKKLWDEVKKGKISLPCIQKSKRSLEIFFKTEGEGIESKSDESLNKILEETEVRDIRRALTYISNFNPRFEMNRISRDGGGTKQSVLIEDVGAFHFLYKLSIIYPSALSREKSKTITFVVKTAPLLWEVRSKILNYLSSNKKFNSEEWGDIRDSTSRKMWKHQESSVKDLIKQKRLGRKGHFLYLNVGLGKTLVIMKYLQFLNCMKMLPPYVVYSLPSSALESVKKEIEFFGFEVEIVVPIKNTKDMKNKYGSLIKTKCQLTPYKITIIEHDYLRRCVNDLTSYASETFFIMDEVHKALGQTQRTAVALQISRLCHEFIALTGTPVIDSNTYRLIWWLEQIVPFEVNEKNFWVAANAMVSKLTRTGIKIEIIKDLVLMNKKEKEYQSLVPPALGGKNTQPRPEEWRRAIELCYEVCTQKMIELTIKNKNNGVFLVAKDNKHQTQLHKMLLDKGVKSDEIFLIQKDSTISLTDEEVEKGRVKNYKIVISPIRRSEGYNLTRLGVMVTSVYLTNNAVREQIEGRINRIGQKRKELTFYITHTGILTFILEKHEDARNLSDVLKSIAEEIKV